MVALFKICSAIVKYKFPLIVTVVVAVILFKHICELARQYIFHSTCIHIEPTDVVYTWVNGSDPKFIENMNLYLRVNTSLQTDYTQQRFDDKYELKFSLRSLEMYAPWIRHVYIVTNGQIPYWLNLDYEKVSLISHEDIFPDNFDLPTFSSPAIESHLHRIPGLSKRFIYFNDDVFLGAPVFLDDFYSESKGYTVYLSWPLPMCAPDCPWMYVSDGQCDGACYNAQCQMDGGDCEKQPGENSDVDPQELEDPKDPEEAENKDKSSLNVQKSLIQLNETKSNISIKTNFMAPNVSQNLNLSSYVNEHNKHVIMWDKIKRREISRRLGKRGSLNTQNSTLVSRLRSASFDAYGASLQHTNRLYNLNYGFTTRQVPAHAPIMIDRDIMGDLQQKFSKEFTTTSRNRFRQADDMQFSFSYYYYVVSEKVERSVGEIFDLFDTDKSMTWSDREIRTLLTQLYELPLSYSSVDHFEMLLLNCSNYEQYQSVSTPEYERYVDSRLPTISKDMITGCSFTAKLLLDQFGHINRFKYHIVRNSKNRYVTFKMLNSNISDVVGHLDEIRRLRKKFICLNDNLDATKADENNLVKAILYDFYLSIFPEPSKFELPPEYKNRFLYLDELRSWKSYHFKLKVVIYIFVVILCYVTFSNICRRRYLCNLVNKVFCFT